MFGKPVVLNGLGCRNTDPAAFILAKGNEVFGAGDDLDITSLLSLLGARRVFRQTKIPCQPMACHPSRAYWVSWLGTPRSVYLTPRVEGPGCAIYAFPCLAQPYNRHRGDQGAAEQTRPPVECSNPMSCGWNARERPLVQAIRLAPVTLSLVGSVRIGVGTSAPATTAVALAFFLFS